MLDVLTRCKYSGKTAGAVHIACAAASDRPAAEPIIAQLHMLVYTTFASKRRQKNSNAFPQSRGLQLTSNSLELGFPLPKCLG